MSPQKLSPVERSVAPIDSSWHNLSAYQGEHKVKYCIFAKKTAVGRGQKRSVRNPAQMSFSPKIFYFRSDLLLFPIVCNFKQPRTTSTASESLMLLILKHAISSHFTHVNENHKENSKGTNFSLCSYFFFENFQTGTKMELFIEKSKIFEAFWVSTENEPFS